MSQELRKALEIARSWMLYSHDGDADDYNEQTWNKYKEDCNIVVTALAAAPVDERGVREGPCCRLDQEFIAGIVRNRSGIDSGEIDHAIRVERLEKLVGGDRDSAIRSLKYILGRLSTPATPKEEAERAVIEAANGRQAALKNLTIDVKDARLHEAVRAWEVILADRIHKLARLSSSGDGKS